MPTEVVCRVNASRRPGPYAGKANVLGEVTGTCTLGAAGVELQKRGERLAEITSGRAWAQQGAGSNLQRPSVRGIADAGRRVDVWRMSPYERRRRRSALPGARSSHPRSWNTGRGEKGSRPSAV